MINIPVAKVFHIPLIQSSATRHWRGAWLKPPRASNRSSLRASSHHLAAVAQHVATKNEVESPLHKQKNVVCFLRMSTVLCMHVYIYICRYKYTYMVFRIKTGKWSAKSAYCHQVISSASIFETTHRLIMVYAIPRCSTLTHLNEVHDHLWNLNPKRLLVLTKTAFFKGYDFKESNPKYPKTPATQR